MTSINFPTKYSIKEKLKSCLEKFPLLESFVYKCRGVLNGPILDIVHSFPLYAPGSAGPYKDRAALTIQAINQTFPVLSHFVTTVRQKSVTVILAKDFPKNASEFEVAEELKALFDKYGSDKSSNNYHYIYGPILKNVQEITGILEIGLGTNYTDVVSNMGVTGKPGASLRAFKDYLPNAQIYGADVDQRILFTEDRIQTYYVDQTNYGTLESLDKTVPGDLDLIIDDGLHCPNANISVLTFALRKLKNNGWFVIEDIVESAIPVWEVVAALLPKDYTPYILRVEGGIVFAVKKK